MAWGDQAPPHRGRFGRQKWPSGYQEANPAVCLHNTRVWPMALPLYRLLMRMCCKALAVACAIYTDHTPPRYAICNHHATFL